MTVSKMIKILQGLEEKLGSRTEVTIDVRGTDNLNHPDCTHYSIQSIVSHSIRWMKDDDFFRKDGSERYKTVIVINQE